MSSFKQPSPAQLDLLLKLAGQQLHIDPQVLRCQLEQGDFSSLQANMDSQSATRLNALLADPQKLQQVLSKTDLSALLPVSYTHLRAHET